MQLQCFPGATTLFQYILCGDDGEPLYFEHPSELSAVIKTPGLYAALSRIKTMPDPENHIPSIPLITPELRAELVISGDQKDKFIIVTDSFSQVDVVHINPDS